MTIPLATQKPYQMQFATRVKRVLDDGAVVLEETYFYPLGGGQPHDTGALAHDGQEFPVLEVRKRDGEIVHAVDAHSLREGDAIEGRIDAERRRRHMRMHTAMHILCAVIEQAEGTQITGNQIGEEKSRLDVNLEEYDPSKIERYVERANEIINERRKIIKRVTGRAELNANPALVKLAAGFPEHIKEIHLVEIEDFDVQPCGGTHVDNTEEIEKIVLLKTENRGKSNRRIYFTLP